MLSTIHHDTTYQVITVSNLTMQDGSALDYTLLGK